MKNKDEDQPIYHKFMTFKFANKEHTARVKGRKININSKELKYIIESHQFFFELNLKRPAIFFKQKLLRY